MQKYVDSKKHKLWASAQNGCVTLEKKSSYTNEILWLRCKLRCDCLQTFKEIIFCVLVFVFPLLCYETSLCLCLCVQSVRQLWEDEAAVRQQAVGVEQEEFSLQLDGSEHAVLHREVLHREYSQRLLTANRSHSLTSGALVWCLCFVVFLLRSRWCASWRIERVPSRRWCLKADTTEEEFLCSATCRTPQTPPSRQTTARRAPITSGMWSGQVSMTGWHLCYRVLGFSAKEEIK